MSDDSLPFLKQNFTLTTFFFALEKTIDVYLHFIFPLYFL